MFKTKFHTHKKTMGKIKILYRLIFTFYESEQEDKKILDQMVAGIP